MVDKFSQCLLELFVIVMVVIALAFALAVAIAVAIHAIAAMVVIFSACRLSS